MNAKYILSEDYGNFLNAGSKAKNDIKQILFERGFECVEFRFSNKNEMNLTQAQKEKLMTRSKMFLKIRRACYTFWGLLALKNVKKKVKPNSTLFIQYPIITLKMRPEIQTKSFKRFFKSKKLTVHILIHDLDGIREKNSRIAKEEIAFLKMAKKIVCHNEKMKEYLVQHGINSEKIFPLNFFDYLHSKKILPHSKDDGVAFAGNLKKSVFAWDAKFLPQNVQFYFYGMGKQFIKPRGNVHLEGGFDSATLPAKIKGGFGLVWDGSSTKTCNKELGEYLRFNSSHKNSLYIVSRMPIIIWKEAALAPVIEKMNIGFSVQTLDEIPERISKISCEQYHVMLENVDALAKKLEEGKSFLEAYGEDI